MKKLALLSIISLCALAANAQDAKPLQALDKAPISLGCVGTNTELHQCLSQKLAEYIGQNYNLEYAQSLGIPAGRYSMRARFKIDTKGDFVDIVIEGAHEELNDELKRVVGLFPKVIPGMIDDKPVKVLYAIPVAIQLN